MPRREATDSIAARITGRRGAKSMAELLRLSVTCTIGLAAGTGVAFAAPAKVDLVKTGHALYAQHCASCHGARGEGARGWQQRDRNGELPAPPHNAHGHTWKHSDAMLYRIVQQGWRDPFNKTDRL